MLDKIPVKQQPAAKKLLTDILYAPSPEARASAKTRLRRWCAEHELTQAAHLLDRDWDRMIAHYRYPVEHWKHLRTTNPIESAFATLRLRTDAAKRFKKVAHASAAVWKLLPIAKLSFRNVNGNARLLDIWTRHHQTLERHAARLVYTLFDGTSGMRSGARDGLRSL